jgi:hypothetical protein
VANLIRLSGNFEISHFVIFEIIASGRDEDKKGTNHLRIQMILKAFKCKKKNRKWKKYWNTLWKKLHKRKVFG